VVPFDPFFSLVISISIWPLSFVAFGMQVANIIKKHFYFRVVSCIRFQVCTFCFHFVSLANFKVFIYIFICFHFFPNRQHLIASCVFFFNSCMAC
jgi:hypothetical protein